VTSPSFGLAVGNFTPASTVPTVEGLAEFARAAESLGYDSLWVWDHLFLGSRRPFPFYEALFSIALLAAHTERVTLGTGVLVLPVRDPVVLAKETATLQYLCGGRLALGVAAGWYQREFEATGIPFAERGRIFEENLELLRRLWTQDSVSGTYSNRQLKDVRMVPRPEPAPTVLIDGYVDRVLRRVARLSDGWLTYFYTPESFDRAWAKICAFAEEAGRDPARLTNVAQLPICVDDSYEAADRRVRAFVGEYFDTAEWSESTVESSIRGTPEQCAEQIQRHLDVGAQHVVFVPDGYRIEQVDAIARDVLPLLGRGARSRHS
jgi:probable F420-dependent oxidoreductase